MSFIPEEEYKAKLSMTFAPPMIDFLFLMLAFFACLAASRITTRDTDIHLVKLKPEENAYLTNAELGYKIINISINEKGEYKWITETKDYRLDSVEAIAHELNTQYAKGLLPQNKLKTQVLLKIDKHAQWQPILQAIFAVRDAGFEVRPVYEPEKNAEYEFLTQVN